MPFVLISLMDQSITANVSEKSHNKLLSIHLKSNVTLENKICVTIKSNSESSLVKEKFL